MRRVRDDAKSWFLVCNASGPPIGAAEFLGLATEHVAASGSEMQNGSTQMDFSGKVVLITGGGSGIGQACAREFAERQATVAVIDRDRHAGEQTVSELQRKGERAEFFEADTSVCAEVESLIPAIASRLGGIDILISNAGIQRYGMVTTISEAEWDEVMNVNLKSAFLMSKYAVPAMIERGGGAIVITGSVQSVAAQRNSVHYVVSKHGLLGLTRCLALDYGTQHIRANCVLPGAIDTPLLRGAAALDPNPGRVLEECDRLHIRGKMGCPEEVARVIVFLASDLASFMTGSAVMVDGGLLVPAGGMAFQDTGTGAIKA
jgi:NAD(P)-dependent dehydrogenase (short-subunit alcohol dehydrogenase family)